MCVSSRTRPEICKKKRLTKKATHARNSIRNAKMHKSNGTSAARGLYEKASKRTKWKVTILLEDRDTQASCHGTQSLILTCHIKRYNCILLFYTIGSIVDCKSLLNLFSNNIQGIFDSHTIVKTSFTFIVVQIFLFLLFRFLLLVGNPRTENADKAATHASFIQRFWVYSLEWTPQLAGPHSWFIHSFVHSVMQHSLRLRFTYPFMRHFWQTFGQNCISISAVGCSIVVVEHAITRP